MALPKLVLTDIDGVWTDGGMYYDNAGNELKKFNTSDSAGVLFCKMLNIPLGIVTGEKNDIVIKRAEKLDIDILYMGVKNKLGVVEELSSQFKIPMSEIAYIGDDINDIKVLKTVGVSACPANAPDYIKKHVSVVLRKNGGEGVFREFIEHLLKENQQLETVIELYLNHNVGYKQ